jgi:undecaprenyl-diphosphatase
VPAKRTGPVGPLFVIFIAAWTLFGWLANDILHGEKPSFDDLVRGAVHSWASPPLTYCALGITLLGSSPFLIPLSAILCWRFFKAGRKHAGVFLVIAVGGAQALDEVVKLLFHRQRPEAFFGYHDPASYSFPSGHAFSSLTFYGVLGAIASAGIESRFRKVVLWAAAALLPLLIGFTRIYLGVHYPSDVLAGYASALIWMAAMCAGYQLWLRSKR